jgi:hypothetical protein
MFIQDLSDTYSNDYDYDPTPQKVYEHKLPEGYPSSTDHHKPGNLFKARTASVEKNWT